jgi:FAD synthase/FMN phosphatase YigB (HAD superfamily)
MVRLKGIKNIIFDFGGVLVDLKPEACLDAFAALGLPQVADYLTPYGHKGPFGKVENGDITIPEFCNEIRDLFQVSLTDEQIVSAWAAFLLHTPLNKIRMVHHLAKNYRVFLLSNTNPVHILKLNEFDEAGFPAKECFEKLYLSYEIGLSKPGREIFSYVLHDAGIKAKETLLVDDGPGNCRTAMEMGFKTFQPQPFEDFTDLLIQPTDCVATLGFFDGVHLGHRFLIEETRRLATKKGFPSMVISFWPHPRMVLQTNYCPQLLTDRNEKDAYLLNTGVDHVRTLKFDEELASMSAFQFMKDILKEELHVRTLVIGFDHRFGNSRSDGFEDYYRYGLELGVDVVMAQPYPFTDIEHAPKETSTKEGAEAVSSEVLTKGGAKVSESTPVFISSSLIRRFLLAGKIEQANQALGYKYTLSGKVVGGQQIGRKIGFPTANIEPHESFKLIPAFGVYAVWVRLGDKRYKGMLNIGRRLTLSQDATATIEVHILDFEGVLYGKTLTIEFIQRFRSVIAFPDLDSLVKQLNKDKRYVTRFLNP